MMMTTRIGLGWNWTKSPLATMEKDRVVPAGSMCTYLGPERVKGCVAAWLFCLAVPDLVHRVSTPQRSRRRPVRPRCASSSQC